MLGEHGRKEVCGVYVGRGGLLFAKTRQVLRFYKFRLTSLHPCSKSQTRFCTGRKLNFFIELRKGVSKPCSFLTHIFYFNPFCLSVSHVYRVVFLSADQLFQIYYPCRVPISVTFLPYLYPC